MQRMYNMAILLLLFTSSTLCGQDGLVAWWPCNDGTGDIVKDKSSNNNDGALVSARWVMDNGENALQFNGENSYIDCDNEDVFQVEKALTITMWVKPNPIETHKYLISKYGWNLYLRADGMLVFETRTADNRDWDTVSSKHLLPMDEWSFIVAVFRPEAEEMTLYINGERDQSKTRTDGMIGGVKNVRLNIGRDSFKSRYFKGLIGEVRLYNVAISEDEIFKLYTKPKHSKEGPSGNKKTVVVTDPPVPKPSGSVAMNPPASDQSGPVAQYFFNEGQGNLLKDTSGHGFNGTISDANWVKTPKGYGLQFKRGQSYVDCGRSEGLNITKDMSIVCWVKTSGIPCDNDTNWEIAGCEEYEAYGFLFRIGANCMRPYFRFNQKGSSQGGSAPATLMVNTYYHLAITKRGDKAAIYVDGRLNYGLEGCKDPVMLPKKHFFISSTGQSFNGAITELAIYNRALSEDEIIVHYRKDCNVFGKDISDFDKIRLTPYCFFDQKRVEVEADFWGIRPLPKDSTVVLELADRPKGDGVEKQVVKELPEKGGKAWFFSLEKLTPGTHEIRALVKDAEGKVARQNAVTFDYPVAPPTVVSPNEKKVPSLPAILPSPSYQVTVNEKGGMLLNVNGQMYPVESAFSYPGGGYNPLGADPSMDGAPEVGWKVQATQLDASTYEVNGRGPSYSIKRKIELQPHRIVIKDTFTNARTEPIGILVDNCLGKGQAKEGVMYIGGYPAHGEIKDSNIRTNPTIFYASEKMGLGMVALDDIYIVQAQATVDDRKLTLQTHTFALDAKASYTMEWAIYLTPDRDYYSFINQVRKDENRNGKVDGGFAFITKGPGDYETVPTKEFIELRNIKYGCIHCLARVPDDPGISVEGIEFAEYPKLMKKLKEQISRIHQAHPDLKVMFHVAHHLYATNKPKETFPDSCVIKDGEHHLWGSDLHYFSKQRQDEGWRWYFYYPTLKNSFGKAFLKSADVMMDQLGCDAVFMDGFNALYPGAYTEDCWDGHTAKIDTQTKKIVKKIGSIHLLQQDALVAFCRKFHERGGTVIANNDSIVTRTLGKETYIIYCLECTASPALHLAPTVTALSDSGQIRNELDIYRDVYEKLQWGCLYLYLQEGNITYPSVPAEMYPFTFDEIHSGYVKGKERLVTSRSGVYGWRDSQDLHCVSFFDGRGRKMPKSFLTTIDPEGVRTQINLDHNEMVVLKKVPISIKSKRPINLIMSNYERKGIEFVVNGEGKVNCTVANGDFPIVAGAKYTVRIGTASQTIASKDGKLSFPLALKGEMTVSIPKAGN